VRIAAAGSGKGSRLILREIDHLTIEEMVRISAAGDGRVLFEGLVPQTT
jgi:hypothetical protein